MYQQILTIYLYGIFVLSECVHVSAQMSAIYHIFFTLFIQLKVAMKLCIIFLNASLSSENAKSGFTCHFFSSWTLWLFCIPFHESIKGIIIYLAMTTFSSFEVISLGLTVLGRMHGGTQNQEKTWNWLRMLDNLMILMMLKFVIIVIFSIHVLDVSSFWIVWFDHRKRNEVFGPYFLPEQYFPSIFDLEKKKEKCI